ncbi:hypothetical protein H6F61_24355 [Cyanobacteria bacterium FACHB-472]|nr:hypothetical protein [Cyanobacteria bacterium FACHB-472]
MNIRCWTNGGEGMFWVDRLNPTLTLRAFDLHCHFNPFAPVLASFVIRVSFIAFEIETGKSL